MYLILYIVVNLVVTAFFAGKFMKPEGKDLYGDNIAVFSCAAIYTVISMMLACFHHDEGGLFLGYFGASLIPLGIGVSIYLLIKLVIFSFKMGYKDK